MKSFLRRRLTFGLSTLFLAVTIVAVTLGVYRLINPPTFSSPALKETVGITILSVGIEKSFQVNVSEEAIRKTPPWNKQEADPPLSAREAIALADLVRRDLVAKAPKDCEWLLVSAELTPCEGDRWYWLINYEVWPRSGAFDGSPPGLRLVVLMDGTVVKPEVASLRRQLEIIRHAIDGARP